MLGSIRDALTALKEKAAEVCALTFINGKIEKFGQVTKLQIDSKQKVILVELALKGESSPISVSGAYELSRTDGDTCISLQHVDASREWIGAVLNEYVIGQKYPVPKAVGVAL